MEEKSVAKVYAKENSDIFVRLFDNILSRISHERNRYFSVLVIFDVLFGCGLFITAVILHSQVEAVSMFTHFVSSLGWGPNGADKVFKYGLVALGILLIPYIFFLSAKLRAEAHHEHADIIYRLTNRALKYWMAALLGLWILAWFVDIRVPDFSDAMLIITLHAIGAFTYFSCSIAGAFLLTKAMTLNGMMRQFQYLIVRFIIISTIATGIGMVPGLIKAHASGLMNKIIFQGVLYTLTPEERVKLIADFTRTVPFASFFEWLIVLSMLAWFAVTGIQTFFNKTAR